MFTDTKIKSKTVPHNFGPLKNASGNARVYSSDGGFAEFWINVQNEQIVQAAFITSNSKECMLSCSALAEIAEGMKLSRAYSFSQNELKDYADLKTAAGCTENAIAALKEAILNYQKAVTEIT
ncbi:FeS cluster assembly scaffold protein NifU [Sedimentisphaera cyanobacteriorum]|uniref:FeS cluster assembly scaffold protein NifU n=1 Tax=Sedimentisphaera cyanobacteriorum TaxID=1940790 RepID=A0A1Q2HRZ9_9BACT|nr:iron-sulfur cluster assembly scaffold protein [Sedimentisphaera cyanobacteriorum]AQQ10003.1 FeS cluster assembly scaffold protein NifU [Sedimentisphaera cyanobacteriorum]